MKNYKLRVEALHRKVIYSINKFMKEINVYPLDSKKKLKSIIEGIEKFNEEVKK